MEPVPEAWEGATRREFITHAAVAGAGTLLLPETMARAAPTSSSTPSADGVQHLMEVSIKVNGEVHKLQIDPRMTLLDMLREKLGLTGSKKGCDHGQCGSCTILVNGRRINSCLALAVVHDGDELTTIEGIAHGDELHPVQDAFIRCDGFQCGYCTPGQIMSAVALMKEGCPTTDEGICEAMSGNICRCGAYNGIVEAIREVRDHKNQA